MAKVICDQKQAYLNEAGDIQIPVGEGVYSSDDIHGELGFVINGTINGRENDEEIPFSKVLGWRSKTFRALLWFMSRQKNRE